MNGALLELPSNVRQRIAEALESGLLGPPYSAAALRSALGSADGIDEVAEALGRFEELGLSAQASAAWIRSAEGIASQVVHPDLVWSGPEVPGLHARDTRRVYAELLGSAERSIWASTYAFFDGPKAFDVLARRMDDRASLQVTLLLNIQRKRADTSSSDALVRKFADRFWQTDWPGSRRPAVYFDPRSLELDGPIGVLHAKAVVSDEEALFITSANLTEAALDRNIEIGLLVRDPPLAQSVIQHFRGLIDRELLRPLPTA